MASSQDNLYSDTLQVERKFYFFDIKENSEGRFLRITEKKDDRRNSIIIPASGVREFCEKLQDVIEKGLK
jgi:hypothetical protein